jgi:hypothetical protein
MNFLVLWCHITLETIDRLIRRSAIPFSLLWLNLITIYLPNTHPYHGDVVLAGDGVTDSVLSFLFPDKRSLWALLFGVSHCPICKVRYMVRTTFEC